MSEKVIDALNNARRRELVAISQYMIEHYELEDAGYGKLGDTMKEIAITEMKHAEEFAERIMFLNGTPITRPEAEAQKGLSIKDMLNVNHHLEEGAIKMYNDAIKLCSEEGDNVSKALFEKILADEESHVDDFQKMMDHIDKLGDVYLATLVE